MDVELWMPWSAVAVGSAARRLVGWIVQDSYAHVEESEDFRHRLEVGVGQCLGSDLGECGQIAHAPGFGRSP